MNEEVFSIVWDLSVDPGAEREVCLRNNTDARGHLSELIDKIVVTHKTRHISSDASLESIEDSPPIEAGEVFDFGYKIVSDDGTPYRLVGRTEGGSVFLAVAAQLGDSEDLYSRDIIEFLRMPSSGGKFRACDLSIFLNPGDIESDATEELGSPAVVASEKDLKVVYIADEEDEHGRTVPIGPVLSKIADTTLAPSVQGFKELAELLRADVIVGKMEKWVDQSAAFPENSVTSEQIKELRTQVEKYIGRYCLGSLLIDLHADGVLDRQTEVTHHGSSARNLEQLPLSQRYVDMIHSVVSVSGKLHVTHEYEFPNFGGNKVLAEVIVDPANPELAEVSIPLFDDKPKLEVAEGVMNKESIADIESSRLKSQADRDKLKEAFLRRVGFRETVVVPREHDEIDSILESIREAKVLKDEIERGVKETYDYTRQLEYQQLKPYGIADRLEYWRLNEQQALAAIGYALNYYLETFAPQMYVESALPPELVRVAHVNTEKSVDDTHFTVSHILNGLRVYLQRAYRSRVVPLVDIGFVNLAFDRSQGSVFSEQSLSLPISAVINAPTKQVFERHAGIVRNTVILAANEAFVKAGNFGYSAVIRANKVVGKTAAFVGSTTQANHVLVVKSNQVAPDLRNPKRQEENRFELVNSIVLESGNNPNVGSTSRWFGTSKRHLSHAEVGGSRKKTKAKVTKNIPGNAHYGVRVKHPFDREASEDLVRYYFPALEDNPGLQAALEPFEN